MKLSELLKKITPLPWAWQWEDKSVVALYGPKEQEDHVLWSGICPSCQKKGYRCTAPSDDDMAYIAHSANVLPELVRTVKSQERKLQGLNHGDLQRELNTVRLVLRDAIARAEKVEAP